MDSQEPTLADAIRALRAASDASTGPHPHFDKLVKRHEGLLSPEEADEIEEHIVHCSVCAEQALEIARWDEGIGMTAKPAAVSPSRFRPLREPHRLEKIAAGLLIATLASTAAWVSTLIKVKQLQSGEVNVPVAAISKGYKGPVESGTADRPVEVLPGAVLIFTPADVPKEIPYEVQITRRDGHVVWTGQGLKPSPKGSFHLRLPRNLSPGTYRLRIVPGERREIVVRVAGPEPG